MPDDDYHSDEENNPFSSPYLDRVFRFGYADGSFHNTSDLEKIINYLNTEMRRQLNVISYRDLHHLHDPGKARLLLNGLREIYENIVSIHLPPELNHTADVHEPYMGNIYRAIFNTVHTMSTPPNRRTVWKRDNNGIMYEEQENYVDNYEDVLCSNADLAIQNIHLLKAYLARYHSAHI